MARLVILSEAQMGRSYELKPGSTSVGRVEDNAFQIAEASVSSHHCELILRTDDVLVRDLNSTNGTFINGQQVTTEAVLKAGQILRLGQIELRLENSTAPATASQAAPAPQAAPAKPAAPSKKLPDQTMVIPQGVKLGQDHGTKPQFDKAGFAKKSNMGTKIFIGAVIVVGVIVVAIIVLSMHQSSQLGTH
jgi:pSer/pThr/pTyr-binding forkhead associated (FHA) protein